jgi:hypothetical protein
MNDGKLFKIFDFFDTAYADAGSNTNVLFLSQMSSYKKFSFIPG